MRNKLSNPFPSSNALKPRGVRGFALISSILIMALLVMVAMGMLSLSSIEMRASQNGRAMAEAQANARMALMIAIGELQKEMGPDMRVSAKAAIFDQTPNTEDIEGVSQPHWLASYESWGNWLNASYENPATGETLTIQDTYTPKREKMFRRWLLSLPDGMDEDIDAPMNLNGWDDSNSVVLVGEGSLGASAKNSKEITRAYLNSIGETGRSAWWIGPENHKARIDMAKQPRSLDPDEWETAQGNTAEVGVGALSGLDALDSDENISDKLVSRRSLRPAGIDAVDVQKHFFDLTASSKGVLASVRTGHLKKDLSLLFEGDKSALPSLYQFNSGDVREPSIRPMSAEITGKPVLKDNNGKATRHFASWTRMRHFYRMYRRDADALAPSLDDGGLASSAGLQWSGDKPWTNSNVPWNGERWDFFPNLWFGQDSYYRCPITTSITYIVSTRLVTITDENATDKERQRNEIGDKRVDIVFLPVVVLWNPFNVELRLSHKQMQFRTSTQYVQVVTGTYYKDGVPSKKDVRTSLTSDTVGSMGGNPIVFKPGEFRIFSALVDKYATSGGGGSLDFLPGFKPESFAGLAKTLFTVSDGGGHEIDISFGYNPGSWNRNMNYGNTPSSFNFMQRMTGYGDESGHKLMNHQYNVDWFDTTQGETSISGRSPFVDDGELLPIGYFQLALKGAHDYDYPTIGWKQDWRCRNWIQAPPFYLGAGLYMSEDKTIAHTQRINCAYEMRFGPLEIGSGKDVDDIIEHLDGSAILGKIEKVSAVPMLELPTAPIGSLAGFGTMRINPGWVDTHTLNPEWNDERGDLTGNNKISGNSLRGGEAKAMSYQSGVTGPGIGNSFVHPIIPRTEVYQSFSNSVSMDMKDYKQDPPVHDEIPTKAYSDFWDHGLLLNDALWDDYFVSSLADQSRDGASKSNSLAENIQKLVDGEPLANVRYTAHMAGLSGDEVKTKLDGSEGYLKAASHLMVDGMFNVNSTSVAAWHALFAGIRERQLVYRDKNGSLLQVVVPSDKRIALSRFNTATTDQDGTDPEYGVNRDDGLQAWSGVRFLDDDQLLKLAEQCVKQVKLRGPFLNFSEFINRRLSDDDLGTMGALQSAIDYDDASPDAGSINYSFKSHSDFMLKASHLGSQHSFATPEAAVGSRFAGIPGYVIQSDLLKPIANTLSVRDDTFRIRAYGDSLDSNGNVIARAWCEAIVQRLPEYTDGNNKPEVPARTISPDGNFSSIEDSALTPDNRLFGRKFKIVSFRWLNSSEI